MANRYWGSPEDREEWERKEVERVNKLIDDFQPNNQAHPFATFIPDRKPQFKAHKGRGTALSAFQYGRPGILYEWKNHKWVELGRVLSGSEVNDCQNCGGEMLKHYSTMGEDHSYRNAHYLWISQPHWQQVQLCQKCTKRLKNVPTEHRALDPKEFHV